MQKIAYLGPDASYTHQAALSAFDTDTHTLLPQITIEDVFTSVQTGDASYGVVPFENSSNGSVIFTLDLFADQSGKHPDIVVCGERYVEVHHCLLGSPATARQDGHLSTEKSGSPSSSGHATPIPGNPSPSNAQSAPLTSLSHIKKLYSHPQAWGQCKTFLSCYLKGIERQDVSSTSRAAELVAADETNTTAAISSGIAAKMHGIGFLARDIEDKKDNSTRFLILRKRGPEDSSSSSAESSGDTTDQQEEAQKFKSLLSFTISHKDPGALADALAVFKGHGLNLTSINPRPSGEAPWHYMFFVEFQGKREQAAVDAALTELNGVVGSWRWLGSWDNALEKH